MRAWLHERPWIWLVVLMATMVLANLIFVVISVLHYDPPLPAD